MFIKDILLILVIVTLAGALWWQDRKVRKLSQVTENEETLTWTDYRGHKYNVVIRRKVYGNGQETPSATIR